MEDPSPAAVKNPWLWVPTLYFAQGVPYVMVMTVSVIMYKRLGISNTDIAFYTSLLYLPWVIKPLWSPVIELVGTKRRWIVALQGVIAALLAMTAFAITTPSFFIVSLALFWAMAFASATHDIAADGFYMLGLEQHQQAAYVGVRSTFYRIAMVSGEGLLVVVAGYLEWRTYGRIQHAWSMTLGLVAVVFAAAFVYHSFVLPLPATDMRSTLGARQFFEGFTEVFGAFFRKDRIGVAIAFLLLYRFAEAQLIKLMAPFLLDPRGKGGLELTTGQVGFAKGTVGVVALLCGGLLGGFLISRKGLRAWLWPMVIIMHLPDLVFVLLSQFQPKHFGLITAAIAVEQFGYGFGFTAYMLYMIFIASGLHKTAHYAICTGFMALGMMLPGMFSGWLQEHIGYRGFFLWVMLSTIPGFVVAALVKIDPEFGRKRTQAGMTCAHCGYDLLGNVSGVCPECGESVPSPAEQAAVSK